MAFFSMRVIIVAFLLAHCADYPVNRAWNNAKCAEDNGLWLKNFNAFLVGRKAFSLSDIEKVFQYLDIICYCIKHIFH